jgi:non-ribosomal peptide synthetase component F
VADPEQGIGELPLLPEAERHQLLVEWNDTAAASSDCGIDQLFEVQAARTPAAVAVVCGDRQLTYSELNARANQVAHQLIALGWGRTCWSAFAWSAPST